MKILPRSRVKSTVATARTAIPKMIIGGRSCFALNTKYDMFETKSSNGPNIRNVKTNASTAAPEVMSLSEKRRSSFQRADSFPLNLSENKGFFGRGALSPDVFFSVFNMFSI